MAPIPPGRRPAFARRLVAATAAALLGVVATAGRPVAAGAAAPGNGFVYAQGSKLMLNGIPWRFTGYDLYQLTSVAVGKNWNCGGDFSQAWLNGMLDQIKADSHSAVIRTWFFQAYAGDNFIQFDTVLNAAAARGIKIIPVLVNQWGECEPNVNGNVEYKTLSWYQNGYKVAHDNYPLSFRDYAIAMAKRYANNPTIAFWQLVNEAEAGPGGTTPCDGIAGAHAIRAFADDMAGAMKAVDSNHLISLGTIGTGQCGTSGPWYEYIHAGLIDICEYHDYTPGALTGDPWNGMVQDLKGCAAMGKPTFAGEVGLDASIGPNWQRTGTVTPQTLQQRATFFLDKMEAQFGAGCQGFLIWTRSEASVSAGLEIGAHDPTSAVLTRAQGWLDLTDKRQVVVGDPAPSDGSNGGSPAKSGGATTVSSTTPAGSSSPVLEARMHENAGATRLNLAPAAPGAQGRAEPVIYEASFAGWLLPRTR